MRTINYLVVHCAATRPSMNVGVKEIQRWHKEAGYLSIGYHYVIRRNGAVEPGRPEEKPGAHVHGYNANSIGICMVGGVAEKDGLTPEDNFTEAQYAALRKLLKELKSRYPEAVIQGHRDFPKVAKACPSFDVKAWWESVSK